MKPNGSVDFHQNMSEAVD